MTLLSINTLVAVGCFLRLSRLDLSGSFRTTQNLLCILQQRHVDHLAIQRESAFAFLLAGAECSDHSLRVFNRFCRGSERFLHRFHLIWVNDLFPAEAESGTLFRFQAESLDVAEI